MIPAFLQWQQHLLLQSYVSFFLHLNVCWSKSHPVSQSITLRITWWGQSTFFLTLSWLFLSWLLLSEKSVFFRLSAAYLKVPSTQLYFFDCWMYFCTCSWPFNENSLPLLLSRTGQTRAVRAVFHTNKITRGHLVRFQSCSQQSVCILCLPPRFTRSHRRQAIFPLSWDCTPHAVTSAAEMLAKAPKSSLTKLWKNQRCVPCSTAETYTCSLGNEVWL